MKIQEIYEIFLSFKNNKKNENFEKELKVAKADMETELYHLKRQAKEYQSYIDLLKYELKQKDTELELLKKVIDENIESVKF